MPLELDEYEKRTRTIPVRFDEKTVVSVTFYPSALTAEVEEISMQRRDGEGNLRAVARQLSRVLVETDITRGGKPVPTTEAELAKLGFPILRPILDAVMEAVTVPPASSPTS